MFKKLKALFRRKNKQERSKIKSQSSISVKPVAPKPSEARTMASEVNNPLDLMLYGEISSRASVSSDYSSCSSSDNSGSGSSCDSSSW